MPEDDRTEALLRAWHGGDRDALSALIDRDRAWILAHLHERRGPALQHDADTLDHFQDLMVEVLAYAPRFLVANRAQFRRLVATLIHNLLADRARRIARRRPAGGRIEAWPSDGQLSLDPAITADTAPAEAAARQEELGWLRLGLEFLSDDDRALVQMHTLDGRSFVELGAELELPANTVRMRCHRAMLRLAGIVQRLGVCVTEGHTARHASSRPASRRRASPNPPIRLRSSASTRTRIHAPLRCASPDAGS